MARNDKDRLPDELHEIDARLHAHRDDVSPLDLDRIKVRTMAKAFGRPTTGYGRQYLMRSKIVTLMLVLGLAVSGGTAGVIASKDGGGSKKAASSQYKPGKGCGDKNHEHTGPPGNPSNKDCPPKAGKKK